MSRTIKRERQEIQTQLQRCYSNHDEVFTWNSHHQWVFVGGLTISTNKSRMGDGGHIEFRKMLISPYWMKTLIAANLVETCNTGQTTDTTARQLSAYNVVESVATTTTSSLWLCCDIFCICSNLKAEEMVSVPLLYCWLTGRGRAGQVRVTWKWYFPRSHAWREAATTARPRTWFVSCLTRSRERPSGEWRRTSKHYSVKVNKRSK